MGNRSRDRCLSGNFDRFEFIAISKPFLSFRICKKILFLLIF
ncbi:hypothetical protein D1BOALGB6SA_4804 [Olavius sp. associated proteobacterium Delta 1]|nr:hypothetical protein D1BOALGB6SA_4804 [Olavius sp. associated proteobacterium Delta 1]